MRENFAHEARRSANAAASDYLCGELRSCDRRIEAARAVLREKAHVATFEELRAAESDLATATAEREKVLHELEEYA